jgi:hypothetical protein
MSKKKKKKKEDLNKVMETWRINSKLGKQEKVLRSNGI